MNLIVPQFFHGPEGYGFPVAWKNGGQIVQPIIGWLIPVWKSLICGIRSPDGRRLSLQSGHNKPLQVDSSLVLWIG